MAAETAWLAGVPQIIMSMFIASTGDKCCRIPLDYSA